MGKIYTRIIEPSLPQLCVRCCSTSISNNKSNWIAKRFDVDVIEDSEVISSKDIRGAFGMKEGYEVTSRIKYSRRKFTINIPICSNCGIIEGKKESKKNLWKVISIVLFILFTVIFTSVILHIGNEYPTFVGSILLAVLPSIFFAIIIYKLTSRFAIPDRGKPSVAIELPGPEFQTQGIYHDRLTYKFVSSKYRENFKDANRNILYIRDIRYDDQESLAKDSKKREEWYFRKKAVEKLNSKKWQNLFSEIAENDEDSDVRIAAIKKLEDQMVLVSIAKNDEYPTVREAAETRLKNLRLNNPKRNF